MRNYRMFAAVCLALALGACGKKSDGQAGAAPAGQPDAAAQVGVSTDSTLGNTLNAPANYMRGMQNKVVAAEKAAVVYEKAAETHDGNKTGDGD